MLQALWVWICEPRRATLRWGLLGGVALVSVAVLLLSATGDDTPTPVGERNYNVEIKRVLAVQRKEANPSSVQVLTPPRVTPFGVAAVATSPGAWLLQGRSAGDATRTASAVASRFLGRCDLALYC